MPEQLPPWFVARASRLTKISQAIDALPPGKWDTGKIRVAVDETGIEFTYRQGYLSDQWAALGFYATELARFHWSDLSDIGGE
jgi:hypothetical protein